MGQVEISAADNLMAINQDDIQPGKRQAAPEIP